MRLLLFLFILSSQCVAQTNIQSWNPYKTTTGKWSFNLNTGEKLNHLQFDSIGMFHQSESHATVQISEKWGLINWHGDTLIPFEYDFVIHKPIRYTLDKKSQFFQFWIVGNYTEKGTIQGLFNERGEQILPSVFDRIDITKGTGEQYWISAIKNAAPQKSSFESQHYYTLDGTLITQNHSTQNELYEIDGAYFTRIKKLDHRGHKSFGLLNEVGDTVIPFNRLDIRFEPEHFPIEVMGRKYFSATHSTIGNGKRTFHYQAIAPDGSVIYQREIDEGADDEFTLIHFVDMNGKLISTGSVHYSSTVNLSGNQGSIITTNEGSIIVDSIGNILKKYPKYTLEYHQWYGNKPEVIDFRDSNELWGVMDLKGNILIPPTFSYSSYYARRYRTTNDTISIPIGNEYVSIDLNNWNFIRFNEHVHLKYFKEETGYGKSMRYFISSEYNKKALLSTEMQVIIPYEWTSLNSFYSSKLDDFFFLGSSRDKLAIYNRKGELLQSFNWKRGTYSEIFYDTYLIQTKRKQEVVNILTGEVIFKTRQVLKPSLAEGLNAELDIYTEPHIIQENPTYIRYYHPKKGSVIVDSTGKIVAKTSGTDAGNIFPIIHQNKVIGSMFHYIEGRYDRPAVVQLNRKLIDSTYNISQVILYPSDNGPSKSNLIEFHTWDDRIVYFTPEGEFVAEYSECEHLFNGNRLYKNERGFTIYSPEITPLLPHFFDKINVYGKMCIGKRAGKECIIVNDSIPQSTILYDRIERKGNFYEAYLGDVVSLYSKNGNLIVDRCLSITYHKRLEVIEVITDESTHWLTKNGDVYLMIER